MFGLELALLTRLTTGLSGQGGTRSDSGSGWSMLVVSVLIKDLVKISKCECRSSDCHNSVGEMCRLSGSWSPPGQLTHIRHHLPLVLRCEGGHHQPGVVGHAAAGAHFTAPGLLLHQLVPVPWGSAPRAQPDPGDPGLI